MRHRAEQLSQRKVIEKPFLAKLAPDGTTLWARLLTTGDPGAGNGVAVDSEHFPYLCGGMGSDPFVSRFSPAGQLLWTRRLTGADGTATSVATHGNRVVITGTFAGTFSFRGGSVTASVQDAFLVAHTREGEQRWARHFGASGVAVGMDQNDGVMVTGTSQDLDEFGVGLPLRGSSTPNTFIARYNRLEGQPLWARGISSNEGGSFVTPTALAVTRQGEGTVIGMFGVLPANFGGAVLAPTGGPFQRDPFILRLAP